MAASTAIIPFVQATPGSAVDFNISGTLEFAETETFRGTFSGTFSVFDDTSFAPFMGEPNEPQMHKSTCIEVE
jgi:hypothetical protein